MGASARMGSPPLPPISPSGSLPHDVPTGVAREDAVRPHRHLAPRVGGHMHAAAARGVAADNTGGEGGVSPRVHYYPSSAIAPQLAALQPAPAAVADVHAAALPVVEPADAECGGGGGA